MVYRTTPNIYTWQKAISELFLLPYVDYSHLNATLPYTDIRTDFSGEDSGNISHTGENRQTAYYQIKTLWYNTVNSQRNEETTKTTRKIFTKHAYDNTLESIIHKEHRKIMQQLSSSIK